MEFLSRHFRLAHHQRRADEASARPPPSSPTTRAGSIRSSGSR